MKPRTIALLLAVWCVLAILPAVIIALFFDVDTEDPSGYVLLVWIVGYLLQFGVFAVVAVKASSNFLGWLIASLVPWSANWLAPMSPWWLLGCAAILVGYSCWFYRSRARSDRLRRDGVPARGVVLEVEKPPMTMVINNVNIRRTLRLRIERDDGATPYEAKYKGTFLLGEIPDVGSVLSLKVDPTNPRRFEATDGFEARRPGG